MFELAPKEYEISRCQFGTLKQGENLKYAPMVFTEQGDAMLSSVLNSPGLLTSTFRSCLMCSMRFSLKKQLRSFLTGLVYCRFPYILFPRITALSKNVHSLVTWICNLNKLLFIKHQAVKLQSM